ncbi:hypothetical protein [Pararhizobium polonicum]|uniref:hypothetical protein n=1 Tax=Pararhizobium polonicum TaxID=1612624 RepID=UPI001111FD66|nr:hypothetical protein [Pararhizobium polonicum]
MPPAKTLRRHLFFRARSAYLRLMRLAILTLTVFCALISGWTASLARVQDLGGMAAMHHADAAAGHDMQASGAEHDRSCSAGHPCDKHSKTVHPLLCAACFAVVLDAHGLDRVELPAATVHPLPQKPMQTTALKPRFPPPKTVLSFS